MILLPERKRKRILNFVQNDGGWRILRRKAPQNDRGIKNFIASLRRRRGNP